MAGGTRGGRMIPGALVRGVTYPLWAWRRRPRLRRYLREFERSQFDTPDELRRRQLDRLVALLRHAYDECPFYRSRMDQAGLRAEDLRSVDDLRCMPLLTKRDIQDHGPAIEAAGFPVADRVRNQTGGSTGSPLQFWVDTERMTSRAASTLRHNAWADYRPGDWCATLWGGRLDEPPASGWRSRLRNELVSRRILLNTSSVGDADWSLFLEEVRRRRARVLVAYTQAAVALAEFARRERIDVRFRSIITTAEVLLPGRREFLQETFGATVFDRYGCREVSVIASECGTHDGMHVNSETLLVEVVPERSDDPSGRIVVTDLLNRSMPLIRYEIGDVGRFAEGACACGRGLPRLAEVQGRTTDFIEAPDGRRISGPALTLVVADMADIRQVQFVQNRRDVVVLRVVPGRGYEEGTRRELRRRLEPYFRGALALEVQEVSEIRAESSGKFRFAVVDIPRGDPT